MNEMFVVNGRFMDRRITGVERYAREILVRLQSQPKVIRPQCGFQGLAGHAWEQIVLPSRLRGKTLWSPCNTGPMYSPRHVVTIHDMAVFDHPEWFSSGFGAVYRALIPELAKRAQAIIAVSAHAKQRILETLKVKEAKVRVIANGVGPAFCARSASEIAAVRSRLQIPEGPYVLSLCSLEPRKNLSRVLAAWNIVTKNMEGVNLVLTGAANATVFRSVAQPLQNSKNVFLTGYVEDENLPALYSGASCFLYVSLYEGFGLPVLEALACNIPVVTSNSTSLREIGYPVCHLVDPCSSHEIASAIAEALGGQSSPESRALGRKHAAQYTWERSAADTERLVLSLS